MNNSVTSESNDASGACNNSVLNDDEAIERVLGGDIDAFEFIMRRYNQRLFRISRSILKNDADAEDALQEAYISVYRNLKQHNVEENFAAWISRITINQAIQHKRQAARKDRYSQQLSSNVSAMEEVMADNVLLPDRLVHSNAMRHLIEQAIDTLPNDFRLVFVMRVVEQMSLRETAEALSLKQSTVKTRQYRAIRRLREQLDKVYDEQINLSFQFDGARCDRITANTLGQIRKM